VAGAEIQYENYVLSRGGTRIIRKILIANNGRASPRPAALSLVALAHAFHFRNQAVVATDRLLPRRAALDAPDAFDARRRGRRRARPALSRPPDDSEG
jgi:hypothetical protein